MSNTKKEGALRNDFIAKEISYDLVKLYDEQVRNQRRTYSCAFIAGVAWIEMNSMKLKIEAADTTKYFLDVQDVFENSYKVYYDEKKLKDKRGRGGASMDDVFQYAIDLALMVTNRCRNPLFKNLYSHCCQCALRRTIASFTCLEAGEAFEFVSHTPIVASMDNVYESFDDCQQVIYMGPSETELANEDGKGHVVVLVENTRIQIDKKVTNFFVLQNKYGEGFGCGWYALIHTHLADEFWVPLVTDQQLFLSEI